MQRTRETILSFRATRRRRRFRRPRLSPLPVMLAVFAVYLAWFRFEPDLPAIAQDLISADGEGMVEARFDKCGRGPRINCVVDGDTFYYEGEKIRVADINAPETHEPRCNAEARLGEQATARFRDLLNAGPFVISPWGDRDEDHYGRKLRVLARSDQSLGGQLVSEGLARPWMGRRGSWCS